MKVFIKIDFDISRLNWGVLKQVPLKNQINESKLLNINFHFNFKDINISILLREDFDEMPRLLRRYHIRIHSWHRPRKRIR